MRYIRLFVLYLLTKRSRFGHGKRGRFSLPAADDIDDDAVAVAVAMLVVAKKRRHLPDWQSLREERKGEEEGEETFC